MSVFSAGGISRISVGICFARTPQVFPRRFVWRSRNQSQSSDLIMSKLTTRLYINATRSLRRTDATVGA